MSKRPYSYNNRTPTPKRVPSPLVAREKGKPVAFGDLGLQTPIPKSMQQSREEKKADKFLAKKKHQESTKKAFEALGEQREILLLHKQHIREEKEAEKAVKDDRKKQLNLEADRARNQRQAKIYQQEAKLLKDQKELTEEVLEKQSEAAKSFREAERLIAEDIAQQIKTARPAVHVEVDRLPEIQAVRQKLPVHAEEQPIIEAIVDNPVVLICGETGSGKTTQIPQFLWEAGFGHEVGAPFGREGMIAVTEPRRVAAVSMAKRVAEELNEPFGGTVCYHVRYDNNLSPDCKLKFMTEGILLKELQSDFLLSKYSVVVVDEAHERSVACDVLVGLLSRVVHLRRDLSEEYARESEASQATKRRVTPLKLIIMSATLRIGDFRDNAVLFPRPPPLLKVEARRFPVSTHFSRKTELFKYVQEAFKKVCQIHKKLPPGGILVFMTSQREIEMLCRMLREHYGKTRIEYDNAGFNKHAQLKTRQEAALENAAEVQDEEADSFGLYTRDYGLDGDEGVDEEGGQDGGPQDDFDYGSIAKETAKDVGSSDDEETAEARVAKSLALMERMGKKGAREEPPQLDDNKRLALFGDDADEDDDWDEKPAVAAAPVAPKANSQDEENGDFDTLHVLPMYALLDPRQQQRVFEAPPLGKRLCVIATNVAETSITIPNIRYVVDGGRVKTKTLEAGSQASTFKVEWTSQASAEQRAGRAGRTGPGHCYRLYSTAVFANKMPIHPTPEILRTPLESVVLLMKHLRIDHVARFPFPTAPSKSDIEVAIRHLGLLGALDDGNVGRIKAGNAPAFRITSLGSFLMQFPLAPRFAKMIFEALRVAGDKPRMVSYVCCIAAMLSTTTDTFRVGEVENFHTLPQFKQEEIKAQQVNQKGLLHAGSDLLTALRAFGVFAADPTVVNCNKYNLVHKTMTETLQLKKQLDTVVAKEEEALRVGEEAATAKQGTDSRGLSVLQDSMDAEEADDSAEPNTAPKPTSRQIASDARVPYSEKFGFHRSGTAILARDEELQLRKIIAIGLMDQVARRASVEECQDQGYRYNDTKTAKVPYFDLRSGRILYIHPTSSTSKTMPPPEYVTYASLSKVRRRPGDSDDTDVFLTEVEMRRIIMQHRVAAGRGIDSNASPEVQKDRLFMKGVTIMTRAWLDQIGFDEEAIQALMV